MANSQHLSVGDPEGKQYQRIAAEPAASLWFLKFAEGCKRRMGQDWRPDLAFSIDILKALFSQISSLIARAEKLEDLSELVTARALFASMYVWSLRGPEGPLIDLEGLIENFELGRKYSTPFTTLALQGKVKGEYHVRQHLMHSVDTTGSGIEIRKFLHDLIKIRSLEGRQNGPAICSPKGIQWNTTHANEILHRMLISIFEVSPELFPPTVIKSENDIKEKYHLYRSFRRASDSRALNQGVGQTDIQVVNRWHKIEQAKGCKPSFNMPQYYAQASELIDCFLRYTGAL